MFHFCARARPGSLLFGDWLEARVLWSHVLQRVHARALALMPDHLHALLASKEDVAKLRCALRAYALWRNHHRAESGPVWEHRSEPTPVRGRQHEERTRRYIHLNPSRKRLVTDPLEWPFSTHRDAVGLAIPQVCAKVRDPEHFHSWVSSDPSVDPNGTTLPFAAARGDALPTLEAILSAVSALTRTTIETLRTRCPERTLLIRAASSLSQATDGEIADLVGAHASTVCRTRQKPDHRVEIIHRVIGDPRFAALRSFDLRQLSAWRPYSTRR